MIGEEMEPWFMVGSGGLIIAIALWMLVQTRPRETSSGESHGHSHDHDHGHDHQYHGDAHAHAHAAEIETRFADGRTTTLQTVLFGLTGGLIPCSAAITVLILCLHLDRFWLGIGLVSAFSAGLAVTLVTAGIVTALGIRFVSRHSGRFDRFLVKAPVFSGILIGLIGLAMIYGGWQHLGHSG